MNKSTKSLNFPDVNVWMALLLENHVHREAALLWWRAADATIAFTRFTQMSVLRLLTTAAAMDGKPLSLNDAWRAYDRLFADERIGLMPEPPEIEKRFRQNTRGRSASPKLWADAWLLAFAQSADGILVTFDRALATRSTCCLLLEDSP
jgi:toxin-antitoxin system PIN domain toxin